MTVPGVFSRLLRTVAALRRDRTAGVTTIFGLAMIPTFAFVAIGVDYGIELHAKTRLDAAADAASMVAITTAQSVITGSSSTGPSVTAAAIAAGQAQAVKSFAANAGTIGFTAIPTPVVQLARDTQNPQKLTATVSYAATTRANLVTALGITSMSFTGTSTSTVTMPTYINYYIITDTSQSMGVGATEDDMTRLYNLVQTTQNFASLKDKASNTGCVFGCHVMQSGGTQQVSNETLARRADPPIALRIDAAISAIQRIITDATNANTSAGVNLIQIGLYTMQQDPTTSGSYIQNVVSPPNSNFTATTISANGIHLGNNNGAGIGDTNYSNSLDYFNSKILNNQGDGSTRTNALNYVFLITDGVNDVSGGCTTTGHCTAAFDQGLCANLRTKATVGVIYTTYNPIYANQNVQSQGLNENYSLLVAPVIASVPDNLKRCATTPDYYFEASDGPAITTGIQKLFASSSQTARLSN